MMKIKTEMQIDKVAERQKFTNKSEWTRKQHHNVDKKEDVHQEEIKRYGDNERI